MASPSEHDGGVPLQGEAPSQASSTWNLVTYTRAPPGDRIKLAHRDGDVILTFDVPKHFEIIVNGKIISDASPVFKAILASNPHAQSGRSVDNPHVLRIDYWQAGTGLILTFGVLHGVSLLSNAGAMADKKDGGGHLKLVRVAETAKQFDMVEFMKPVISPGLLKPYVKRSFKGDDNPSRTDAELAAIAYLLDQPEEFSLFTRRLIMDHCGPLSTCSSELFETIPAKAICISTIFWRTASKANLPLPVQLEEQRIAATQLIDEMVRKIAMHHCNACKRPTIDFPLAGIIGKKLNPPVIVWPPSYGSHHTIRQVLAAIAALDADYRPFRGETLDKICCAEDTYPLKTGDQVRERCEAIAYYVSMRLPGLCLTCVKIDCKQIFDCEHRDKKLYQKDSFT